MRSFLQRKEALSTHHKIVFKDTTRLMKKLLNLNQFSKVAVEKFRNEVTENKSLIEQEKRWFLQQIAGR
jgi:hypothetical protein